MTALVIARRQVVLLPFRFSDLSAQKLRPALVLADAGKGDWLLCQITSKPYADLRAVAIADSDFASGGLQLTSYARPAKLFAAQTFRDGTAMAQQVFGGVGFTLDYDIQLYFRRAKALQISWLDDVTLREMVAATVLDEPA